MVNDCATWPVTEITALNIFPQRYLNGKHSTRLNLFMDRLLWIADKNLGSCLLFLRLFNVHGLEMVIICLDSFKFSHN